MISVLFRYDDCSGRSPADFDRRLAAVFQKAGVSCLFGIVPCACTDDELSPEQQDYLPLGAERAAELREWAAAGVIEPALHGCYHQNNGLLPGGATEFAGLPADEQLRRIREGRKLLEDALQSPVHIFIPPFNRFDEPTLRILEGEGFTHLSASLFDDAVSTGSPMRFVPHTCNVLQVETTVSILGRLGIQGAVVVPLLHPADFLEANPERGRYSLDRLVTLLHALEAHPDVCFLRLADTGQHFGADRFVANRSWMLMATGDTFPRLPMDTFPRTAYFSIADAKALLERARRYGRILRGAAMGVGSVVGGLASLSLPPVSVVPWLVLALLVCALILRRGSMLAFRYQLVLWFLLGAGLGGGALS